MGRHGRKLLFVGQVPGLALLYLLTLGQWQGGDFLAVLRQPPVAAFVALSLLWYAAEVALLLPLVGEPPLFGELAGFRHDSRGRIAGALLLLPEAAACIDRGQLGWDGLGGRTTSWLGLGLLAGALLLVIDADRRVANHYRAPGALAARTVIESGPFALVRHPRSAALVVGKLGAAMALNSALGFLLLMPALLVLPRFLRGEEEQLLRRFGDGYRFYRARTKRLVPWVY